MPSKLILRACAAGALALALTLASVSCATRPPTPEPQPLPISWPTLPPPPETGIELTPDERAVIVPLGYWTDLVGYVRAVDDVRAILAREGMLAK